MADSGGDIVFERMQAQAAKARARAPGETGEAGRSDEEGTRKLLIASSSTPAPTRDDGAPIPLHPPPVPWFPVGGFYARRWRWAILAFAVRNGGKLTKM